MNEGTRLDTFRLLVEYYTGADISTSIHFFDNIMHLAYFQRIRSKESDQIQFHSWSPMLEAEDFDCTKCRGFSLSVGVK